MEIALPKNVQVAPHASPDEGLARMISESEAEAASNGAPAPRRGGVVAGVRIDNDFGASAARDEITSDSRGQLMLARLLAHDYRGRLLHVHGLGWHAWDGTRWAVDEGEVVARNAVIDLLRREWVRAFDKEWLKRDVERAQTAGGVAGVLDLAKVLEGITARVSDVDADPWKLNVANGTLDLHSLRLLPHNPDDLITKVTRAAYLPGERSEEWEQFLARSLPDPGVRGYLARFMGVALIGEVIEQEFTLATGEGGNGKGVFYESAMHALGDYALMMDSDLLTPPSRHGDGNSAKPGLVNLRGRRFVVTSETEREVKLAAALMKRLTGGDPITARALYRDPIEFDPTHTLLMVTNHLPKVPGNDPAVWRRVRVVPWDVVIPEAERDTGLKARLKLTAVDAILTWAIDGLADYRQRGGMDAPEAVRAATADYQRRSDAITRFLDDRCLVMSAMFVPVADLWSAWLEWSRDDGADDLTKREFNEEMDKRGFRQGSKRDGRVIRAWLGIGLQGTEEGDQ